MASQTLNGVLLPLVLIVMLRLINDKRLMGKYVNSRFMNILTWASTIAVIALTVLLVIVSVFPNLFTSLGL